MPLKRHVIESTLSLLYAGYIMRVQGLEALYDLGRRQTVHEDARSRTSWEQLCRAMDFACIFYFRRVLCLQRSAATAALLRRHGWNAEMVTGVQILPLESHAWVEIDGTIVNDAPYMREIYQVFDHC
jgi:hypothetical protein